MGTAFLIIVQTDVKPVDLLFLSSCQESAIDTQLDNRHIMLRGDTVRMKNIYVDALNAERQQQQSI